MKTKVVLTILFLGMCIICPAQTGKLFTVDKELPSSMVNRIYQDNRGYIWIATENGICRYDGSKFTTYKYNKDKINVIKNNFAEAFYGDEQGHLFVGYLNGLQQYDFATDTYHNVTMKLKGGNIVTAHVTCFCRINQNDLLIGTAGHGIFLLKLRGNNYQADQQQYPILSFFINCIFKDHAHNLWISTINRGVFRINKRQCKQYFFNKKSAVRNISAICESKNKRLYVGALDNGLFQYNSQKDQFELISQTKDLPIKDLCVTRSNKIIIGTDGKGIKTLLPSSNNLINEGYNIPQFDFSKSKVHSIIEDKTGNLWMGVFQKGVLLQPTIKNAFQYFGYKSSTKNIIGSCCVMSLCKDRQGTLWIGTDNDGLYGIDSHGKLKVHFAPSINNHIPHTIMSVFEDSNGNLWIGSFMEGLMRMNKKDGICTPIKLMNKGLEPAISIYSIVEDSQKNLWIGSMGTGLFQINLNNNKTVSFSGGSGLRYNEQLNDLHNGWINTLMITKDNKLYIGTYDGIGCLDLKTKSFVSTYKRNRLLPGAAIFTTYEDFKGNIWIGTSDGLMCIDHNSHKITSYNTHNGLPSNTIYGIKGNNRILWISTNYGISQFDFSKKKFTNFYANDGLQENEFSRNAAISDTSGMIYFGGVNGVTYFNPNQINIPIKKLNIYITDFYIHDAAIHKGTKSGIYDIINTAVTDAQTFHLSHNDNSFSIEFSTMEFNNPERITYMYSLNEEKWVTLQPGTNRVSFSNLSPGKYHFKIKAKDYEVYSNIKEITIIISPPWYLTIWAKLVYILLLFLIAYFIMQEIKRRYNIRQQLLKEVHEKEINEAKLQFFINISHEIRTPMTLIISPLERLLATDNDDERRRSYRIIYRNANRILNLVNQLMDIRKIDKGQMIMKFKKTEIIGFVKDILAVFEYEANKKQIKFTLHTDLNDLQAYIDPKNFDKIIMNLLSNAFKFTPKKGAIDIYIQNGKSENNEFYEITISDNGIAIDNDKLKRIFERFYQINNSQNNSNVGTGIGLHLTQSLVELHHGSIYAVNNEDQKGCRFIVRMPLGDSFFKPEEMDKDNQNTYKISKEIGYNTDSSDENDMTISQAKNKHRILIVEDDEEIRKYLCSELSSEWHMSSCTNGKEALSIILKKAPDLVVSDIMMPEMDGMTLCRKIKQNININHIPVILLTAKTREEDNIEGLSIGADSYITKPFNIAILKKTITNLIKNRETLKNSFSGMQYQEENINKIQIKSPDEKLLERIMKAINKNIGDTEFNVESLAEEVGISRVHLHRKLKELTNQTTRDFIRNIRLQEAASIIKGKNQNITEVSRAVGFVNVTYFSTAFKELYGITPSKYAEKYSDKKE
jgi:signal transduction histidine kinase/ligand-binding sensor domain-containing protein/DNA-binding response OmpR family regulator